MLTIGGYGHGKSILLFCNIFKLITILYLRATGNYNVSIYKKRTEKEGSHSDAVSKDWWSGELFFSPTLDLGVRILMASAAVSQLLEKDKAYGEL